MYNTLPLINTGAILFTIKVKVNLLLRPLPLCPLQGESLQDEPLSVKRRGGYYS